MTTKTSDYVLDFQSSTITVKADGSAVSEDERLFTSKNESGRNRLALETIPFSPDLVNIQVLKAASITGGNKTPVDTKSITQRSAAGDKSGVTGLKELVIPFTNLEIGSSISYKTLTKDKKAIFPGVFSTGFAYGYQFPELAGEALIKSEKKLNWAVSDPSNFLSIVSGKEGKYYTLKIKLLRPFVLSLQNENIPIYSYKTFPFVYVTTLESWNELAKMLAIKYEKTLSEELPPLFKNIVAKAEKKSDVYEKIDTVTSELASVMTYSGNWTTLEKMYFPKGHQVVAKSKTGDCKDFATSVAAMLRKLGMQANVALVNRRSPYEPFSRVQSSSIQENFAFPIFNHAIVRIELPDKKIIWVDPTNTVSNAKAPGEDIAASSALNISAQSTVLERIPETNIEANVISIEKSLRLTADEKVESKGKIEASGVYSTSIVEAAFRKDKNAANEIVLTLFGSMAKEGVVANYSSRIASKYAADIATHSEGLFKMENEKKSFMVALPQMLSLYQLGYARNRSTDFFAVSKGTYISKVFIEGFDIDPKDETGCWAASPWFEVERKIFKVEKGIEVRDQIVFKKDFIPAEDLNSKEYSYSLGDLGNCVDAQLVKVIDLDPKLSLNERLKDYTLESLHKLYESGVGPERYSTSRQIKLIADQLLEKEPNDLDIVVEKVRATKFISMRVGDIYGPTYLEYVEKWVDDLLLKYPDSEKALIQKSYNMSILHKPIEAAKYFTKAYYASKDKGYSIYRLGGVLAEDKKDYATAKKSYLKALEFAKSDFEKKTMWSSLGGIAKEQKDLKNAQDYYERALLYSKEDPYLMNDLVLLAIDAKSYDRAIEVGEKLLKKADFGAARYNLANAYYYKAKMSNEGKDQQTLEKAGEFAMKGLKWSSDHYFCSRELAKSYENLAFLKNDITLIDRAIDIRKKNIQLAEDEKQRSTAEYALEQANRLKQSMQNGRIPASNSSGNKQPER